MKSHCNFLRRILIQFGFCLSLCLYQPSVSAFHLPAPSPTDALSAGFSYCQAWLENFHGRPLATLMDERALVNLWFVSGDTEGLTNPLAAPLADCLEIQVDKTHLWGGLEPALCLAEAERYKGSPLTEEESQALSDYFSQELETFLRTHEKYMALDIFKSAAALNLQSTLTAAATLPEALDRLARQHHLLCDHVELDSPTEDQILQLLREKTPLLLQKASGTSHEPWLLVFAAFRDSTGSLQLLANQAAETTMGAWNDPREEFSYAYDQLSSQILNIFMPQYPTRSFPSDQCSDPDKYLLSAGFTVLSLPLTGYTCHVMRNWHYGIDALAPEISGLMACPAAVPACQQPEGHVTTGTPELWQYFFYQERPRAGLDFQASLIPSLSYFPAAGQSHVSCLLSTLGYQQPAFKSLILTSTTFWRLACRHYGKQWLPLSESQIDQLDEISEKKRQELIRRFGPLTRKTPLEHQLAQCLPALADTSDLQQAVASLEDNFGWQFNLEAGSDFSWEKCRLAIQRRLPLIIKLAQTGEYCLGFGYLEFQEHKYLLVFRPALLSAQAQPGNIATFSPTRPEACDFIDFESDCREISCLFNPHPTLDPVAQEVLSVVPPPTEKNAGE